MAETESWYSCPVCIGVIMAKIKPSQEVDVMVDYCRECGGMWFDRGESDLLRQCRSKAISKSIVLGEEAYLMKCHSCQVPMNRNEEDCQSCGWQNVIECPIGHGPLKPTKSGNLKLDVCSSCQGVWFDNTELAQIWNNAVAAFTKGETKRAQSTDHFYLASVLDVFVYYPVNAPIPDIGGVFHAVGDLISSVPEAAGCMFEGAGALAGSIFESLPGVAGAMFEGSGDLAGAAFSGIGDALTGIDLSGIDAGDLLSGF